MAGQQRKRDFTYEGKLAERTQVTEARKIHVSQRPHSGVSPI